MNGKLFGQSKATPKSFLTGQPFKPNSERCNKVNREINCLITNKMTKDFMKKKNNLYFENKKWLDLHGHKNLESKNKEIKRNNLTSISSISSLNTTINTKSNYKDRVNIIKTAREIIPCSYKKDSKGIIRAVSYREKNKIIINDLLQERLYNKMTLSNDKKPKSKIKQKLSRKEIYDQMYKEKNSKNPKLHSDFGKIPE